ncbi:YbaK / prolyl-tRNA synthetases associated domain protein [compost metagenome]
MKRHYQGYDAFLAQSDLASELTMCPIGAIPPFTFHPDLDIAVDSRLLENDEIVFNVGLLDKSIVLQVQDYEKIVGAGCIRSNISKML